jgi:glucose/arabinose dehydrogenase
VFQFPRGTAFGGGTTVNVLRDVIQAPDGSSYLLTDDEDGEILRLTPDAE